VGYELDLNTFSCLGVSSFINDGFRLYEENGRADFMAKLDAARSKPIPLLSKESYNDWEARFRKALYKEKESFITSKLPEFINSWQTLIDKRSELLKNPKVKSLTTKDVEDLNDFLNDKRFGELSNKKRIGLVTKRAYNDLATISNDLRKSVYLDLMIQPHIFISADSTKLFHCRDSLVLL
jgi:hypothetical protein